MDVDCAVDYRLKLWAPTSASRAISEVAEFFVFSCCHSLTVHTHFNNIAFQSKADYPGMSVYVCLVTVFDFFS